MGGGDGLRLVLVPHREAFIDLRMCSTGLRRGVGRGRNADPRHHPGPPGSASIKGRGLDDLDIEPACCADAGELLGQSHGEPGAARIVLSVDRGHVSLDDCRDDRKAESAASRAARPRRVSPAEAVEDVLERLWGIPVSSSKTVRTAQHPLVSDIGGVLCAGWATRPPGRAIHLFSRKPRPLPPWCPRRGNEPTGRAALHRWR